MILLSAMVCMGLQATLSLPTNTRAPYKDIFDSNTELSDPNSPLRIKVKQYMNIFATDITQMVDNTLQQLPNSERYQASRRQLIALSDSIQGYVGPLKNCVWNIVDLSHDLNVLRKYFKRPNATPEDGETMRLLVENGWAKFHGEKLSKVWWNYIQEKFGSAAEMNGDYCTFR